MDDNERRRFNRDENDYYTNNSRRTPVVPPRNYTTPAQGVRRDYGQGDRGYVPSDRGYSPQNGNYVGRTAPAPSQNGVQGQRPYGNVADRTQGNYGAYDNSQRTPYRPAQPSTYGQPNVAAQYPPQGQNYGQRPQAPSYGQQSGYPQQPAGYQGGNYPPQQGVYPSQPPYAAPQDERDYSYENVQAQPAEKKKRGLFGFGKQKKEEIDPNNIGNVIITEPRTFDDVRVIIDGLRKRQAIIIDLSKVNDKDAQRTLDMLSGAIYALGGAQQRINDHMFLFTPEGVMIQGPASLRNKYR